VWVEDFSPPNPERGCFYFRKRSQFPASAAKFLLPNPRKRLAPQLTPIESVNASPETSKGSGSIWSILRFRGPFLRFDGPEIDPSNPTEPEPDPINPGVTFPPTPTPLFHVHLIATAAHPINLKCKWPLAPRKPVFPGESKTECSTCVDS